MLYQEFIASKMAPAQSVGFHLAPENLAARLFPFQRAVVAWALRQGRCALFEDCGLGKSCQQLEWARQVTQHAGGKVLIFAPLTVARQTMAEAALLGMTVTLAKDAGDMDLPGVYITNYDRFHKFTDVTLSGIVLDESSILKSLDGKTRSALIENYQEVPFRLCCTATPAPNDIAEIANHSEFLGVKTRAEMLATYFVHDADGWRLKKHATRDFYRWLASWAVYLRKPSDIGFDDKGYDLPELVVRESIVACELVPDGQLFPAALASGLVGRGEVRRSTLDARVDRTLEVIRKSWTGKNTTGPGISRIVSENSQSKNLNDKLTLNERRPGAEPNTSETPRSVKPESMPGERLGPTFGRPEICGSNTISPSSNSPTSGLNRGLPVEYADSSSLSEAAKDCTLTTTTFQGRSEGCSVPTATAQSACSRTSLPDSEQQPNTSKEQWVIWCGLNDEQNAIARELGDDCISVSGDLSTEEKTIRLERWLAGEVAVLVTKAKICGFGMNFQRCSKMVFCGIGDSWEAYYQCLRRCWRFGQASEVNAYIVVSDAEQNVLANVMRKEEDAKTMGDQILANMGELERANLREAVEVEVPPGILNVATGPDWTLHHGDCVEVLAEKVPPDSVALSVYSPPFATLYTYSDNPRDMGNSKDHDEFFQQFDHFTRALLRVTMPGRLTCAHVAQIPTTLNTHGEIGISDFRGKTIAAYQAAGWVFHREVCIDKCPQAQAIRTHSKALLFVQMKKDRSWSGPALADYILVFRKPGKNPTPIQGGLSNDEWVEWARPIWYGIRESDTLNVAEGRAANDERHICPLQLGVIDRCVRLWSNPGETVLSPFAGIGSEGYQSIIAGRKFLGVELKPEYWQTAQRNLRRAQQMAGRGSLFEAVEA